VSSSPNPNMLDFSAPEEDVITVLFPDGKTTCDLPTTEELSISTLQFLASSGEKWYELFQKPMLSGTERAQFDKLNNELVKALCEGVPEEQIEALSNRRKARIIVAFMTASPELLTVQQKTETERPTTES
jgi:hypothetical protein